MTNADKAKKTTIYLIRHAVTDYNQARKFQGSTDISLNADGRAQALKLCRRIINSGTHIDKVYISNLSRTRQTIQPLLDELGLEAEVIDGVEEINAGDLEGLELSVLQEKYPDTMKLYSESPYYVDMPNGETGEEVYKRGSETFEKILAKHQGETVLVISHGYLLQLLIAYIKGLDVDELKHSVQNNTAITKVEIDNDGNRKIIFEGDDSHLN